MSQDADTSSVHTLALTRVLEPAFADHGTIEAQRHHTTVNEALVDPLARPIRQPLPADDEAIEFESSRQDGLNSESPIEEVISEGIQTDTPCADANATTSPVEQPPPALVLYEYEQHGGSSLRPVPVEGQKPWEDLVQVTKASLETWSVHLGDLVAVCLDGGSEGYAKVSELRQVEDGRYMVVYTWLYTRKEIMDELKFQGWLSKACREHVNCMWPAKAPYEYMLSSNRTVVLWDTALSLAPKEVVGRLCRSHIYITTDFIREIHPVGSPDDRWLREILDLSPVNEDANVTFDFCQNNDGQTRGFEYGVPITSTDVEIVQKREYLHAAHIQFFVNYLQAQISAGQAAWKPYFFGPNKEESIRAGWEGIYKQQNLDTVKAIATCDYFVFSLGTGDHWFLAIVSHFKDLCQGKNGAIYVLDSKSYDHEYLREDLVKVVGEATKFANSDGADCGHIDFYQAVPETLPQQSEELCGFYLMAYLEAFAADPDALLDRIRQGFDGDFQPGCLDSFYPQRFLKLLQRFLSAEERHGQLYDGDGQLIIDGNLSNPLLEAGSLARKAKRRRLH